MQAPYLSDSERKTASITALCENFDRSISRELAVVWLHMLAEYTPEQVAAGVARVLREYEYKTMPPFAVLNKAIRAECGLPPATREPTAEERLKHDALLEWDRLIDAVNSVGPYRSPELSPRAAFVLRGMGGWQAACSWLTDDLHWRKKEFVESFRDMNCYEYVSALAAGEERSALEQAWNSKEPEQNNKAVRHCPRRTARAGYRAGRPSAGSARRVRDVKRIRGALFMSARVEKNGRVLKRFQKGFETVEK